MAISFIPEQTGEAFIIGGQSTIGPFPKYSVNKEVAVTGDGTVLNNKYNISINGQFIVDSDVDIGTSGARQSNYNKKIIERLSAMRQYYSNYGRLEISPYGGQPNKLIWNDAKLMSVDIPESSEESSSILYSSFTFNFEAYTEVSILGATDNNFETAIDSFDYDKFYVSSVEESWDLTVDEDSNYISGGVFVGPTRTYTITHNLSAMGLRKPLPAGGFDTSAWREAQKWVQSRLVNDPSIVQSTDVMGGQNFTDFAAKYFGNAATATSTNLSDFFFYNHVRTPKIDIAGGSYSVTETWKASNNSASTIDLNIDIDVNENQIVSLTASGSIQGLDNNSLNNPENGKIQNAESSLIYLTDVLYDVCKPHYDQLGTGYSLPNIVKARSIGRNQGTGVITFSYSYNDNTVLLNDALTTDLSIVDDNKGYEVQIIAEIQVIAKTGGPVIQDMNTSRARRRTVQLDAVIKREVRTNEPPAQGKTVALSYAPSFNPVYIQTFTENWNPLSGSYSVSVEWTY